jgi:glycosyltransferase involved in cell wall biosynthesis
MLTHSYYEEDPRVRREAESLAARGRPVDVYALRRPGDGPSDVIAGVRLHRVDVQRHQGAGLGTYLAEYLAFFARAGWSVASAHRRRHYELLQVHTLPDFLVFAGLPLRLVGVPLVLDLHEAMPEFFRSRFPRAAGPVAHRLLLAQERLAIAVADAVVTVNDALADRLVRLGVRREKITVLLNSPSLARFDPAAHPRRAFMADGRLRLVYTGALTPTYELDLAVDAVAWIAARRPELDVALELYGRGDSEASLRDRATQLGIGGRIAFHGRIPIEDVPAALAAADIGLAPTRRDEFTDFSLSTKIFEYAAMAKPAVATRLPMVERTFPEGTVTTYEPADPSSMAAAILRLVDDPLEREARVARSMDRVRELSWEGEADRHAALVDRLARDGLSSSA